MEKAIEIKSFIHKETKRVYKKSQFDGHYRHINISEPGGHTISGYTLEAAMKDPMMEIRSIKLLKNVRQ